MDYSQPKIQNFLHIILVQFINLLIIYKYPIEIQQEELVLFRLNHLEKHLQVQVQQQKNFSFQETIAKSLEVININFLDFINILIANYNKFWLNIIYNYYLFFQKLILKQFKSKLYYKFYHKKKSNFFNNNVYNSTNTIIHIKNKNIFFLNCICYQNCQLNYQLNQIFCYGDCYNLKRQIQIFQVKSTSGVEQLFVENKDVQFCNFEQSIGCNNFQLSIYNFLL
ncbi:unnamed protein product [Paramecium sonneborni]|uniref:Uncharacterized protein n=1 Tax=Paramecium sonneborni TaxID=65129 RepID=A0A8S1RC83_9CILI|nr:unnamed protein product [Paramecium sonneborni]